MGDRQAFIRPAPACPHHDIQIKCPRTPTLALAASAKRIFNALQQIKKFGRLKTGCNHHCAIGVFTLRWPQRTAARDRAGLLHGNALSCQFGQRGAQDRRWAAIPGVSLVGSQRYQITVQTSSARREYNCGRRSRKKPMPARCLAARCRSMVVLSTPVSSAPNSDKKSPHSSLMKLWP